MKLPIQSRPVLRNFGTANIGSQMTGVAASSRWVCRSVFSGHPIMGTVDIWWGHTAGDAAWACDNWISGCRDSQKGCLAYGPVG